jgi:hypothetical protein
MGIGDDAIDRLTRRKAEQEGAVSRELVGCREGDHVDPSVLRHRLHRLDLAGEQRPEDELGALGQCRAGGARGTLRRSFGVARQQDEMLVGEIEQRDLRRIQHGPPERRARPGERQQQGDMHLLATARRRRRLGRAWGDTLGLAERLPGRALQGGRRGRYPGAAAAGEERRQSEGKDHGPCRDGARCADGAADGGEKQA